MLEYVDPQVESLRESSSPAQITLLLGVSGTQSDVEKRVEETGATVEDTLGQATLRVTTPESAINSLCEIDGLKSIEVEREDVQILTEGDFHSRRRVTR